MIGARLVIAGMIGFSAVCLLMAALTTPKRGAVPIHIVEVLTHHQRLDAFGNVVCE